MFYKANMFTYKKWHFSTLRNMGGGAHNKLLSDFPKEIWNYLLNHGIMITLEYLSGILNLEAD